MKRRISRHTLAPAGGARSSGRHWAEEAIGEGLDTLSDMCESRGFVGSFFEGLILIDALLDEDALERSTEVLLFLLREENLQLFAEEELRVALRCSAGAR